MDPEDLDPPREPAPSLAANLEAMSETELKDHMAFLEGELERTRRTLEERRQAKQGADSLFSL